MKKHEELENRLRRHKTHAPENLSDHVMQSLPDWRRMERRGLKNGWLPALAGALATLVIMLGVDRIRQETGPETVSQGVTFHFELHAPGADQVELLGTFNDWKAGDIVLDGPDASGHWTATVELPEGRHEYIFLVDGTRWMADPKAATLRPDGFGNVNAVIQVYDEDKA